MLLFYCGVVVVIVVVVVVYDVVAVGVVTVAVDTWISIKCECGITGSSNCMWVYEKGGVRGCVCV